MRSPARHAVSVLTCALFGCSDTATFVTGTSLGIKADANTEQLQIGYARAELFQGPNYPDVGDAPEVVGFFGSDLKIFSPHIRQLYATGDAANIVTNPGVLLPCPTNGQPVANSPPNNCPEQPSALTGERRALIFGTGTNLGLKVGFTGNAPSSIDLGYDREELSIIPLHAQAPQTKSGPDKYTSVVASLDVNPSFLSFAGSDLELTQFFATGSAARNLAKNPDIQAYFKHTAIAAVDQAKVQESTTTLTQDQKDIDAYFSANSGQNFNKVRDRLLTDPQLTSIYPAIPDAVKTASTLAACDSGLAAKPTLIDPISAVARRLISPRPS